MDRKQTEEPVRQHDEPQCLALQAADMGWWNWDLAADAMTADDRAKALFGLPPAAAVSFGLVLELTHPADRPLLEQRLAESLAAPGECGMVRAVWRDGSIRWVSLRGRAYHDDRGKPLRLMGIVMDNTRREQTEEQLRRHAEEVESLTRAPRASRGGAQAEAEQREPGFRRWLRNWP